MTCSAWFELPSKRGVCLDIGVRRWPVLGARRFYLDIWVVCFDMGMDRLDIAIVNLDVVFALHCVASGCAGPGAEESCEVGSPPCVPGIDTWPAGISFPGEAPPPVARRRRAEQAQPGLDMPFLQSQGVQSAVFPAGVPRLLRQQPWGDGVS